MTPPSLTPPSLTPQRVTLITLGVRDLDAARAFYARLGWVQQPGPDGVAFFQMHGCVLGLFGLDALAADQGRAGAALGTGAATLAQNFRTTAEVDQAFAAALTAGGTALKAPKAVFWGGYSGYWADPDGHVWEVAMNPFWPLAGDGSLTLPGAVEPIAEMQLSAADDAAIAGLLARCFDTDFGGRSYFIHHHSLRLVLRDGAAIISHMALTLRSVQLGDQRLTVAGLADVATDPAHRGQGHAATLLRAAIDAASASPAAFVLLFGNARLYAAAGFRPVTNPVASVATDGTRSVSRNDGLMVLPLRGDPWPEGLLDLRGPVF